MKTEPFGFAQPNLVMTEIESSSSLTEMLLTSQAISLITWIRGSADLIAA
jgi:hypothetical protein